MPDKRARAALAVACVAYLGLGLSSAAIGPLPPQLASQTGTQLGAIGAIFFAVFSGGLISRLAAGTTGDRYGPQRVLLAGIVFLAAGTLGVSISGSLVAIMIAAFVAGLGHGSIDIGANLLVVTACRRENVAQFNCLHLLFGLESVGGPLLVSLALARWLTGLPALWLAVMLLAAISPFVARVRVPALAHASPQDAVKANRLCRSPALWSFAFLLLLYVGLETGMGGWITAYLGQTVGMPVQTRPWSRLASGWPLRVDGCWSR